MPLIVNSKNGINALTCHKCDRRNKRDIPLNEKSLEIIYAAIDQLNEQSDGGERIIKQPETKLFGGDGGIDSLDLVNLVVAIEHHIEDTTGDTVMLVDESTMEMENNPFQSIATLAAYLDTLLGSS